ASVKQRGDAVRETEEPDQRPDEIIEPPGAHVPNLVVPLEDELRVGERGVRDRKLPLPESMRAAAHEEGPAKARQQQPRLPCEGIDQDEDEQHTSEPGPVPPEAPHHRPYARMEGSSDRLEDLRREPRGDGRYREEAEVMAVEHRDGGEPARDE